VARERPVEVARHLLRIHERANKLSQFCVAHLDALQLCRLPSEEPGSGYAICAVHQWDVQSINERNHLSASLEAVSAVVAFSRRGCQCE